MKALYATGFFRDVRLEVEGDVLVVIVQERPTISQIDVVGAKEFEKDILKKALKDIGVAESRIFDRSALDRAEQELKRQYINRGFYGVKITTTVTPQERNRVAINFNVEEGEVAKIARINIVGTQAFSEATLIREMQLSTPGWLTWYTKNDQYSKQKLQADLETLRSYYTDRGYLEFDVDSTQVSITPDKDDIYITINITEGPQFTVSDVRLAGELLLPRGRIVPTDPGSPGRDLFPRKAHGVGEGHIGPVGQRRLCVRQRQRRAGNQPRGAGLPGSPSTSIRAAAFTSARSTSAATRKRATRLFAAKSGNSKTRGTTPPGSIARRCASRDCNISRTSMSKRRLWQAAPTRSTSTSL